MRTFSKTTRRNLAVFFAGPAFLVPAVLVGIPAISIFYKQFGYLDSALAVAVIAALYGLFVIAYPLALVLGLPAIYILQKFNKFNLLNLTLVSFMGATLVTFMFGPSIWSWLMFCYCSASVSFGCWYIYQKFENL